MKTLLGLLLALAATAATAQNLPVAGDPTVVNVTAYDEQGHVLYHRLAYIFFAGPTEYGIHDTALVAKTQVTISRLLREDGARCDDVLPTDITETCAVVYDYCQPPAPKVRK